MTTTKPNVLMIDNYDSFTWNLYEYLCQEGAQVQVYRNDKITIPEIEALNPDRIVISPGPGHPLHDSGISRQCIEHFAGKIPVIGVCMGQQCIYSVFGGSVEYAGEIVHGKTSTVKHDAKGIFDGVSQDISVTRYHSLAGTQPTLPEDLEVTARTDSGVIMGVRHKKYTVEGVQFHPESILTEEGHLMVRNFLNIQGGTWEKDAEFKSKNHTSSSTAAASGLNSTLTSTKSKSILDQIFDQRKKDVEKLKSTPGKSFEDLKKSYALGLAPPQIKDVVARLKQSTPALMAEIKRASPSKGPIDLQAHAASQALIYAEAGASAISILTEPHWFKGDIDDLRDVRKVIDSVPNRPAVLRKEFIFDEYQILEARLAGADTVLLIVKMLDDALLQRLYDYSVSLGMEPLVEVNSAPEMKRALAIGSKLIGVNNRDLHSFSVDLNTTSSLVSLVPEGTVLAALSGISGNADVRKYYKEGVSAILVGEALMKASSTKDFIKELLRV
ncbi:uncharacterized protein SAPINGB_P003592 [Magnusiomyces paraingens]|uniref:Multifunctional tryptophan biosynthesis protein n=1 Tax=Magnusiomyces paraingens TaxID=2606893 RepID=A0A5E8BXK8_9ASCO|nr:uncharacterized protein SAPINGB_P003592 [Saprochaete ingens]VVT53475.1 unnamed protein product [Saprochaete ingens]